MYIKYHILHPQLCPDDRGATLKIIANKMLKIIENVHWLQSVTSNELEQKKKSKDHIDISPRGWISNTCSALQV